MPTTETSMKSNPDGVAEAQWTTAYVNRLPDSAFAYVGPGGTKDAQGRTTPRSLRYLPYKDADGNVDPAHVRNALARLNQTDIPAAAKTKARRALRAAAKKVGVKASDEGREPKGQDNGLVRLSETVEAAVTEDAITVNDDGSAVIRDVLILREKSVNPGPNGKPRRYRRSAMEAAVPLYEGLKTHLDHSRDPEGPRDVRSVVGRLSGVRLKRGELRAAEWKLLPSAGWLAKDIASDSRIVGLSQDAMARYARDAKGNLTHEVEAIVSVRSVDVVAEPGSTRGVFESRSVDSTPDESPAAAGDKLEADDMSELVEQLADAKAELKEAREETTVATKKADNLQEQIDALTKERDDLKTAAEQREAQDRQAALVESVLKDKDLPAEHVTDAFRAALGRCGEDKTAIEQLVEDRKAFLDKHPAPGPVLSRERDEGDKPATQDVPDEDLARIVGR